MSACVHANVEEAPVCVDCGAMGWYGGAGPEFRDEIGVSEEIERLRAELAAEKRRVERVREVLIETPRAADPDDYGWLMRELRAALADEGKATK